MEIPKEIVIVSPKEKKPLIKDKRGAAKIALLILSLLSTSIYFYYYPAPTTFSFNNALPIAIALILLFITTLAIAYTKLPFKKSLLIACMCTATMVINKSRIITIVTYAICIPLLCIGIKTQRDHEAKPLPESHD